MSSVLKQLFQETAIDPAVTFLKSLLADGGVMSRGHLTPFANGGVVNGPTVFPMANGMGLMGEAGPEAIMPLKRGADGKLGVEGGGGVTVVQNINVSTGVQQTVRTEIKSLMPQIAQASKAAVVDAKRRGGSYGRNFA
jgi:phage-related minor tail protein